MSLLPGITFDPSAEGNETAEIELEFDNEKLNGWVGLNLKFELDACAFGFSFDVPYDVTARQRDRYSIFGGQKVKVIYRGKTLLEGTAEVLSFGSDTGSRNVNIQGRSKSGRLLEDNVEPPFQYDSMTFGQICSAIGRGLVSVEEDTPPIPRVNAEPGQTIYEFLTKIASPRGYFAQPDSAGKIIFGKLPVDEPAEFNIKERSGPVQSVSFATDLTKRFTTFIVSTANNGQGERVTVQDPEIPADIRGVKYIQPEQNSTDLLGAGYRALALSKAEAIACSLEMSGWEYNGQLLLPGKMVELEWPDAAINIPTKFRIAQSDLKLDTSNGKSASLSLKIPESYQYE